MVIKVFRLINQRGRIIADCPKKVGCDMNDPCGV
jgi:hypothetical protein